jgi:hypothetical protein
MSEPSHCYKYVVYVETQHLVVALDRGVMYLQITLLTNTAHLFFNPC